MLEAAQHTENSFLTLTYAPLKTPLTSSSLSELRPKDLSDWLKRFRFRIHPLKIRYYAVGEYGDKTWRPHYHVALFGYPHCRRGNTFADMPPHIARQEPQADCCDVCDLVRDTWGHGRIFSGDLSVESAQYVSGYVTKKLTAGDGWECFLEGRHPEFSRMSNRPGIGFSALHEIASEVMRLDLDTSQPDVPSGLRHGKRILPLGRYLRRNLRKMVGRDEKTPQAVLDDLNKKMLVMQSDAIRNKRGLKGEILAQNKTASASLVARHKIHQQRKKL